jgi:squalene cyclase
VRKAVSFLLSTQNANGGWGESYLACVNKAYPEDGTGEVKILDTYVIIVSLAGMIILIVHTPFIL